MSRAKKSKRKSNSKNMPQERRAAPPAYFIVVLAVCVVLGIVVAFSAAFAANRAPKVEFIPPEFEKNAVAGEPSVPEDRGYELLYQEGMSYTVGICGAVTVADDALEVYFTNPAQNDVWLKLRVLDEAGNILGETGLLRPGEYVRTVLLEQPLAEESEVRLKIMAYEPETYFSAGSVSVRAVVLA